jgi:PAS domain S-box-containing protein
VSPREDSRRRRAAAVATAAVAAIVLVLLVFWHARDLRSTAQAATQRQLTTVAARSARMFDVWIANRRADATTLTEVASIHGSDSLMMAPALAGRILHIQMNGLARRGTYPAMWMIGASGKIHGALGNATMSEEERGAAARAIATGRMQLGAPEMHDSIATVAIVAPIMETDHGTTTPGAAFVLRADLNDVLSANGVVRPPTTASFGIAVSSGDSIILVHFCGPEAARLCVARGDTLAHLALTNDDYFGRVASASSSQLVATHRDGVIPWAVYYAMDERTAFAPVSSRLRFEALLLLGVLLVAGLGAYAFNRSAHLRRLTERAQTEARFAAIVNTALDAIMIVDAQFAVVDVNSAAESMFGYRSDEALQRSVLDLIPDASRDELRRALEQTLRAGEKPRLFAAGRYAAGRRKDASIFPIDLSVSRTQIDGRPHLTIVIRDITEWRRAEESSEWQRRVLESIASGVELREVLKTIARFHETQCPGVEVAIHLIDDDGLTLRTACAPSMRPEFVEGMDEIVVGPNSASCGAAVYRREQIVTADIATDRLWNEYRALALEQGYRACWSTPIRSPQGRVLGALAMYVKDSRQPTPAELRVTATATHLAGIAVDRAHAAESLRQSEASFRSFVENSPIGIYRATGTGRLLAVNASLVQLLGYNSALELLQVDMAHDLFASTADRERLLRQLQAHGELRSTEMEWRRKDGTLVTVRISARAYRDERGSVWFSEGFVENVTPLRAAEQALRQSEKLAALGQLVSGVAHELNNPLAAILHFAEDLLHDERSEADLEALSVIRDQARRSRSIVRDLLSFVRFRDAARERVQLSEALAASVKALQPTVEELGARLVAELPAEEVFGNTDRTGVQQIVTNLVVNAAQASGPGGEVRLIARVVEHELQIVVEDTGAGIPPKLMDRIFEPFFTTKPVGQGTGLGLSVTLGIVQQLGGRIAVENRTPDGSGARFTVNIPVLVAVPDPGPGTPAFGTAAVGANPTPAAPAPRVLIIDDEPSIRAALRRFFARRGWDVEEAEDGAAGLSLMLESTRDFTVVISDLKMPGCSGVELHDHVASVAPELLDRIIFSTGDVASKEAAEFVQRTRCTVMQKPFELRALEAVVMRLREVATA